TGRDALSAVVALAHKRSARPSDIADKEGFVEALLAPLDRLKVTDDGAGEDNTGSKTTGTYNNWNQGDLFLGFLVKGEGDIVGEVATGRLSMILDIVRGVKRTLATCLAPHLGVTPKGTHIESEP
ncbi:hypothetical protein THAOC_03910, partial [Thalassiosira oceanica]